MTPLHAITWSMRHLAFLFIFFFSAQVASAQSNILAANGPVDLGNGVFLDVIPSKFETYVDEASIPNHSVELVVIPATFENIEETVVIQEAFQDLRVTPASLSEDGAVLKPAQAEIMQVPAVTKTVTRRVMVTPARTVERRIPNMSTPRYIRKRVSDPVYIFRDEAGTEIARYEDPLFAMRFIEALPN